ncbi:hypothetical protein ASJ79_23760 [Mycobacterium sp. NAZ190054]|nr:hypothetical protein ASJ79_23760 [Mycobacterium sp. NAZ190054]
MSDLPDPMRSARAGVRSVLLLCWRDTGHPQGGGSEANSSSASGFTRPSSRSSFSARLARRSWVARS